VKSKAL